MKALYPLLFLLSFFVQAAETNTHNFFQDKLSMELSTEQKQLSQLTINKRYGKQKIPPAYAFSNKEQNVSFTITQYQTPADKKSMRKIHKSLSIMLRKSSGKAQWKKDKVYTRLGTKVAVYEYESKGIGKYQYNITYALPVDGRLTLLTFITTDSKYKKKWVALARASMNSIQLKEPKKQEG